MTIFALCVEKCLTYNPVNERDKSGFCITLVVCGLVISLQVGA